MPKANLTTDKPRGAAPEANTSRTIAELNGHVGAQNLPPRVGEADAAEEMLGLSMKTRKRGNRRVWLVAY